jgi:multiple sugar transport system permease protein
MTRQAAIGPKRRVSPGDRPILWILPLLLFLFVFFLFPLADVIRLSFTNATLKTLDADFTLSSYARELQDSAFGNVLWVTGFFVAFSVVFQFLLGFGIAYTVDSAEKRRLRGTVVVRTVSLISWAIPGVAIGIIWKILYAENASGIFNYLLSLVGVHQVSFLSDPKNALLNISIANVWRGTAQSMILLYAGIKTVSLDILEAADVDGVTGWQKVIRIIVPSMRSVIMVNILLNVINTFNTFDMIMPLTGGGPGRSTEVLVLSSYRTIFQQLDLGKGCAIAVILLMINVVFSLIYIRANKEEG